MSNLRKLFTRAQRHGTLTAETAPSFEEKVEIAAKAMLEEWLSHAPTDPIQRARYRRAGIHKAREFRRRHLGHPRKFELDKKLWLIRQSRNIIADALLPDRAQQWILPYRRTIDQTTVTLSNFSLLDNPIETLASLREIIRQEATAGNCEVDFSDQYCLDIGAYMLIAEIWQDMLPIFNGGNMDSPVQKVLYLVGLADDMGIELQGVQDLDDVSSFPLRRRRVRAGKSEDPDRLVKPLESEFVADEFCDRINEWIGIEEIGCELSEKGRNQLLKVIGELLDNAERHSDLHKRDGDWSIAGFMARRDGHFLCHLGFVSLGATIFDSMQTAPESRLAKVNDYVRGCRTRGCRLSDATLTTVYALQDTVTRDHSADSLQSGGFGFQNVFEWIEYLGRSEGATPKPRVTILSGNSCIMLRNDYIKGVRKDEHQPRVLWFNGDNTSDVPPDADYAFDMPYSVPGTVISVGFALDPDYIRRLAGHDHG